MPTILWVADRPDWAWHWMGTGVAKYAPPGYRVDVIDQSAFGVYTKQRPDLLSEYDAVLQCSWTEASMKVPNVPRSCTLVASHGIEFPFPNHLAKPEAKIATRLRNSDSARGRLPRFDAVLCVNEKLHMLAQWINHRSYFTPPGVDTEIFVPETPRVDEPLRVGWCGQRTGVTKGYQERLVPLMERMGRAVEFVVNDRSAEDALTQAEMVEWFARIDVLLSTSYSEGCQMPIMEAMACGKPVVATDAGLASSLVKNDYSGYLIDDETDIRVIARLADALYRLAANPASRVLMGGQARWLIENHYSWKVRAPEWVRAICGEPACL